MNTFETDFSFDFIDNFFPEDNNNMALFNNDFGNLNESFPIFNTAPPKTNVKSEFTNQLPALVEEPVEIEAPKAVAQPEQSKENREWKIHYYNQKSFTATPAVTTFMHHKRESIHHDLDLNLYSSIRYHLYYNINASSYNSLNHIYSIVTLRNVDTHELVHTISENTPILLTEESNSFKGHTLVKIPSQFSYHYKKQDYYMNISLYNDNNELILQMLSAQFRLFARKPNKKQYRRKKRTRETKNSPNKRIKSVKKAQYKTENNDSFTPQNNTSSFSKFKESFNNLVAGFPNLDDDQKQQRMDIMIEKLILNN